MTALLQDHFIAGSLVPRCWEVGLLKGMSDAPRMARGSSCYARDQMSETEGTRNLQQSSHLDQENWRSRERTERSVNSTIDVKLNSRFADGRETTEWPVEIWG